jgi:hypothetical protein
MEYLIQLSSLLVFSQFSKEKTIQMQGIKLSD